MLIIMTFSTFNLHLVFNFTYRRQLKSSICCSQSLDVIFKLLVHNSFCDKHCDVLLDRVSYVLSCNVTLIEFFDHSYNRTIV